jgi:protein involved in polysaccharide export with SLBB domain
MTKKYTCLLLGLLLAPLMASSLLAQGAEELLRPGDQINLKIASVPPNDISNVSSLYTVSGEGTLRVPYIKKEIQAAGFRPSVLAKKIEDAYKAAEIYTAPRVIINVDGGTTGGRFVSISGEVKTPGDVSYRSGLTLLTAISARAGFTDFANKKSVKLIRSGRSTNHNMTAISRNPKLDVALRPGDKIIVIPRKALSIFGN